MVLASAERPYFSMYKTFPALLTLLGQKSGREDCANIPHTLLLMGGSGRAGLATDEGVARAGGQQRQAHSSGRVGVCW